MKKYVLLFLVFINLSFADYSQTDTPYIDGQEFNVPLAEYQDLLNSVEHAKVALESTLKESKNSAGEKLYQRLIYGIKLALQQSALKQEFLLFRYILNRALEIDRVFTESSQELLRPEHARGVHAISSNVKATESKDSFSSTLVLLPSIKLALAYYQSSDIPRLQNNPVLSPDWIQFAADQVSILLTMANLAPSSNARLEIVKRAVGWTARSLNTSIHRRKYATKIIELTQILDSLQKNEVLLGEAQALLFSIEKSVSTESGLNLKKEILFPLEQYPTSAVSAKAINDSSFGGSQTQSNEITEPKSNFPIIPEKDCESCSPDLFINTDDVYSRVTVAPGVGAVFGSLDGKGSNNYAGRVQSDVVVKNGGNDVPMHGFASASGSFEKDSNNSPVYGVKAELQGSAFVLLGVWLGIEYNVAKLYEEEIIRLGWAPGVVIKIGEKDYVLIRGGIGGTSYKMSQTNTTNSTMQAMKGLMQGKEVDLLHLRLSIVAKLARFFINLDFTRDTAVASNEDSKFTLAAALTVPLKILFPNDSIQFDASVERFEKDIGGENARFTRHKLGVFYGLQW